MADNWTEIRMDDLVSGTNVSNLTRRNANASDYVYYEYDIDLSIRYEDLLPTSIIYGLTFLLGILGNTLIIFTIARYRRMRSITNVFLMSLASADLLLILICVPVRAAKLFSYTWVFGEFLCKFVHYMQNVSAICSVYTMTSMSLERYYAILHPMKAKYICTIRQARKVIASIWIFSFVAAVPIVFVQIHLPIGKDDQFYWCVRNGHNDIAWRSYEIFMLFLILVIPVHIMGFAYFNICREVWHVMRLRATMTGGETRNGKENERDGEMYPMTSLSAPNCRNSSVRSGKSAMNADEDSSTVKQVIKMLVAVVVLFIICWTPLIVNDVLTAFGHLDTESVGSLKHMRMVFNGMAYFNSCINPLVYGFMSRNFRQSFLNAITLCRPGRNLRQMSVSHTRTTSVSLGRSLSVSTRDN